MISDWTRSICYPDYDSNILDFYEGLHDCVYIAFHPFYKIGNLNPADFVTYLWSYVSNLPPETFTVDYFNKLNPHTEEPISQVDFFGMQKSMSKIIPIDSIQHGCQFKTRARVFSALSTAIGNMAKDFRDDDGYARLKEYCLAKNIFEPSAGRIQPAMEHRLSSLFLQCGFSRLALGEEYEDDVVEFNVGTEPDLVPWAIQFRLHGKIARVFDVTRKMSVVVEPDGFFSLICGQKELLGPIGLETMFEGFWCDRETKNDWGWGKARTSM